MSQENVEVVQEMFDAFTSRGELRTSTGLLDDSIVFDTRGMEWENEDFVRVYFGPEGVRDFWREWLPAWSDMRVDVLWIRGIGDRVLVWLHQYQVGRTSGLPVDFFLAWDILFRAGKIVRVAFFRNEQEALEAVGLSEQDAHADS
jgi:ketosteroid isomerase-like protein